jgi:endoglucanase
MPPMRPLRGVLLPLAMLLGLAAGLLAPAQATSHRADQTVAATSGARTSADDNPLAGRPWGTYEGGQEMAWAPYEKASGTDKDLLGYIALAPKAKWFGSWIPDSQIAQKVDDYIVNAQHGDPQALVQMTIFRVNPWEHNACTRLPTKAERASYRQWIDSFAQAVGSTYTAIVLQPDAPFALCAPHGSLVPSNLVSYAAKKLSAQPNTSVYIEAGAADWPHAGSQGGVDAAVKILVRGGIQYAHGFALNSTHYDSTTAEVARAAAIAQELDGLGYPDRKAVINTSTNGHPFEYGDYDLGADANNPKVCGSVTAPSKRTCVTIGIPPTVKVGAERWGLPRKTNRLARTYVDAYLWIGRPWLHDQADPFVTSRALKLVRSTPWYSPPTTTG